MHSHSTHDYNKDRIRISSYPLGISVYKDVDFTKMSTLNMDDLAQCELNNAISSISSMQDIRTLELIDSYDLSLLINTVPLNILENCDSDQLSDQLSETAVSGAEVIPDTESMSTTKSNFHKVKSKTCTCT